MPHRIPIEPELDLHAFAPADIPSVVDEYIRAAHETGLRTLRLAHGRGHGVQRAIVQMVLERHPLVEEFWDDTQSHLGATCCRLSSGAPTGYDPEAWEKHLTVDNLQRVYDGQGWEGPRGRWRQRSTDRLAIRLREISEQVERPVTILDVGCFSGEYFGQLAKDETLNQHFLYTGVDVTPSYVANATQRWKAFPNAQFRVGSALLLDFPERSFDIVFSSGLLIHMADPGRCIAQAARVARHFLMMETTVNGALQSDFIDEGKSGRNFIDRVYRPTFVEALINEVATIIQTTDVPYLHHVSSLYECTPRP